MEELIPIIKKALEQVDVVLGWAQSPAAGVAVPAFFHTPAEADAAVFDSTCAHNLAVYLPRLADKKVGIVAKGCDARSIAQLIAEGAVKRSGVFVIGASCPGMIDVKKAWRCFGFGKQVCDAAGKVAMEGKTVAREEILLWKCRGCRDPEPVICDVTVGEASSEAPAPPAEPAGIRKRFAAMTVAERRQFWQDQFSRCIRCYACREACPLCVCRDVCTIQAHEPGWAGAAVDSPQSWMAQLIRVNHLAGRCTGCEECERACPVGIPLMLLLEEQNDVVEELFGYRAGGEAKPPFLTFDIKNDTWDEER